MCKECGCDNNEGFQVMKPFSEKEGHGHDKGVHRHFNPGTGEWFEHSHGDHHSHGEGHPRAIEIQVPILDKNDRLAERNRGFFKAHKTVAINLMSSPGSGKTALLEKTLEKIAPRAKTAVLVGDITTDLDGRRLDGKGAQVLQITTGSACHLDAEMVAAASEQLDWDGLKLLFIENVGNLVCPAAFDLGETKRVVLFSVTEGEDKPLKYPVIFRKADLVLVTKIDLAEAVEFDKAKALEILETAAPDAKVLCVSAKTGQGLDGWLQWIKENAPVPFA